MTYLCLLNKVPYVEFPMHVKEESVFRSLGTTPYHMFLGQMTRYATPRMIRWLIWKVTRCVVKSVFMMNNKALHYACCFVYAASERDVEIIMDKFGDNHVFMDQDGAWVASTPEERAHLKHFRNNVRGTILPSVPLPMHHVSVEPIRNPLAVIDHVYGYHRNHHTA